MAQIYRDLLAWQKSMDLVERVNRVSETFPKYELYGLSSQLRRAAVSVPSNIAEGQGRRHKREFQQFLGQARGSLMELETQVLIAHRLHYISQADTECLLSMSAETGRILNGLICSLN